MSDKQGGKWTPEAKARQQRRTAVRQPLSIGVATAANFQPALAAVRKGVAVSVMPAGVVSGEEMRRRAWITPGAFFGGDLPVKLVPMPDWEAREWAAFFMAAGWSAEGAEAMAAGARAGEFERRTEREVMVMPGQRELSELRAGGAELRAGSPSHRQSHGQGHGAHWWDGVTKRVLREMEKGYVGGIDGLAAQMQLPRDRVAKAMNRLFTRGLVLSDKCRPARYILSSKGGFDE